MRLLSLADTHIGSSYEHRKDALADTAAVLDQVVELAVDRGVSLVLHGGDVFHRTKPSPAELHVFKRFCDRLWHENIPLIAIHGNGAHEAAADDKSALQLFESDMVHVSRRAECINEIEGVSVCTLPATPLGRLVAQGTTDRAEIGAQAVSLLLQSARDLYASAPVDRPRVLLGHWAVSGSRLPNGLPVDALSELVLPLAELETIGYDACLFGHIHVAEILNGMARINIHPGVASVGSPMCHDFGEAGELHGCWILEFGEDRGAAWEFVPLTDRRFVTVDVDLTDPLGAEPPNECPNCEGRGWIAYATHAPGCNGFCSEYGCPVQEQAQCEQCGGSSLGSLDETDAIASSIAAEFPLTDAVVRVRYRATEEQHHRVDQSALLRLLDDAGIHRLYGGLAWEPVRENRTRAAGVDETLAPLDAVGLWLEAQSMNGAEGDALKTLTAAYLETLA